MNKLIILILIFIPYIGISQNSGLIFQSGFEPNTEIVNQNSKSAEIVGIDRTLKNLNDWENELGMNMNIGYFKIQYQGAINLSG